MTSARKARSTLYRKAHGKPEQVFDEIDGVTIEAFPFDFSPTDDEDAGYVLFTNGMSERRMHLDAEAAKAAKTGQVKSRAELTWYVRDLDDDYIHGLRWLAAFPFIDDTWLGFGHTVIMPSPIITGSQLVAYFLLSPIIRRHNEIGDALRGGGEPVELLVVHLLTLAEYELKKRKGVDAMLDLFDEHEYPLVLDPTRDSMV